MPSLQCVVSARTPQAPAPSQDPVTHCPGGQSPFGSSPTGTFPQAPAPSQDPVRHVPVGHCSFGSKPAETNSHVPSSAPVFALVHASHVPSQAASQQTKSTQKPLVHWNEALQAWPLPSPQVSPSLWAHESVDSWQVEQIVD